MHTNTSSQPRSFYPDFSDVRIQNWRSIPLAEFGMLVFIVISVAFYFLTSQGLLQDSALKPIISVLWAMSGSFYLTEKIRQEYFLYFHVKNNGVLRFTHTNQPLRLNHITEATLVRLNRLREAGSGQFTNLELITNAAAFSPIYSSASVRVRQRTMELLKFIVYGEPLELPAPSQTTNRVNLSTSAASSYTSFPLLPASYVKPGDEETQHAREITYYRNYSNLPLSSTYPEELRQSWQSSHAQYPLDRVRALFTAYSQNRLCISNFFSSSNEHTIAVSNALRQYDGDSVTGLLISVSREIGDRKVNPKGTLAQIFRLVMAQFNISPTFVPAIANMDSGATASSSVSPRV